MRILGILDLVVLALALPVFVAADLPLGGYATAVVIWGMWRGIGAYTDHKAAASDDPRRVVGLTAGSMIGRGWMMGLTLIAVGLSTSDQVGLSAALTCVICFTTYFTARMLARGLSADLGPASGTPTPSS